MTYNSWSDLSAKQQFDVWLASVLAKAWDEGANVGTPETAVNPYRIARQVVEDDFGDASIQRAMVAAQARAEDIYNMPNPSRLRGSVDDA